MRVGQISARLGLVVALASGLVGVVAEVTPSQPDPYQGEGVTPSQPSRTQGEGVTPSQPDPYQGEGAKSGLPPFTRGD